ncbi:mechanosensitive ion channel family protein [Thiohalocapsa marina]|uniref:Mechanosensitive ion channel family protein n=1 Tax=Thiohalocapsa marina TaxID=424902 RepID=A0A5M8FMF9_9GAMM|nr:mechanosensitive ion channel family protein [Thiohalocapsa marina]
MLLALVVAWQSLAAAPPRAIDPQANPLRTPDTSSPRTTLESLFRNLEQAYRIGQDESQPAEATLAPLRRAKRTLDLSEVPRSLVNETGTETALLLKEVLDRVGLPPLDSIPDADTVVDKELEKWRIPHTEMVIHRVASGPRTGEWLFSPATVENAREFHELVADLPYLPGATPGLLEAYTLTPGAGISFYWAEHAHFPGWLSQVALEQALWQWLLALLSILLTLLVAYGVYRLARRREKRLASQGVKTRWPTLFALALALLLTNATGYFINSVVNFTGEVLFFKLRAFVILNYSLAAWIAASLLTSIPEAIISSRRLRPRGIDSQLLRLGFRLLALIAIAAIVIDAADRIGLPAYSVLTGLGVGGIAVALAARETLANLLGSISIMLDRPFRIGDWIKIGNDEGTVEDIGFRTTRIRTFYDSLLSVPNSVTTNATIDNMGRRKYRRVRTFVDIRYDTPPAAIEAFLEGIKEVIKANPCTRKDYFHVVLHDFGPHSLKIMLYFFVKVPDWSAELVERQRVLLEIVRLAAQLDVRFAFPTQTVAVENLPGQTMSPTAEPTDEQLLAAARQFASGGNAARPRGLGLFTPPAEEGR